MLVQFLVVLIYSTPSGPFFFAFYAQPAYQGEERAAKIGLFCPWFATEGTLGSYCAHATIGSTPCILAPTFSFVHLSACMRVLSLRSISACRRMRLSLSVQNLLSIRANLSPIAWRLSMKNTEARRTTSCLDAGGIGAKIIHLILADEIFPPKFSTPS